jgi:serine/threonine protein kinase
LIGKQFGAYEIVGHLGSGGMGEVYRATDTKLGRDVAIKVLPADMASNAERLARFEREARTLASLHHPHVASLFGFEEVDEVRFLVMELVEGEDLSQRLARGPLSLDETLDLARQVASGLEVAHAKGIVHRDLKPANIKFASDGQAKILDFGLARAYADENSPQDLEHSPTITAAMTQAGVILGTAAYMSPEQAKGGTVDKQTDVFAFGCLLYECLAGQQAFAGDSVTDVLASVLRSDPDWSKLPSGTAAHVRRVIERCIEKDPRNRLRDVGDVELLLRESSTDQDEVSPVAAPPAGRSRWIWPTVTALLAIVLLVNIFMGAPTPDLTSGLPRVSGLVQLTDLPGLQSEASISPGGRRLLYTASDGGDMDIFLQRIGGENPINLTADSPDHDGQPEFSPDGERIAFSSDREGGGLFVMGAMGETPRRVSDEGFDPTWSPDGGKLAYTTEYVSDPYSRLGLANLWVVDLETGEQTHLDDMDAAGPSWSPHGHRIAFWTHLETVQGQRDLWTIDPEGGEPVPVLIDAATDWSPSWSPDGQWLYFVSDRGGSPDVWRIAIDEEDGEAHGEPQPVTTGMARAFEVSVGTTGRLAVTSERRSGRVVSASFDPATERLTSELVTLHSSANAFRQLEISRDGQMLSFGTTAPTERIYVMNVDGSGRRKLIDDEHRNRGPSFSPDGRWVVFYSNRSGTYDLWAVRTDGTGLRQITDTPGDVNEPEWHPDGRLTASIQDPDLSSAEVLLPESGLEGVTAPCELRPLPGTNTFACLYWSPDGLWAAGGMPLDYSLALYSSEDGTLSPVERDGKPVPSGGGPTWIDSDRLLIWDPDRDTAALFDRRTREIRPVPGVPGPSQFAVGDDGTALYMSQVQHESDVWLLTLEDTD